MAEYIKREDALRLMAFMHGRWDDTYLSATQLRAIPTADVAPVVHARWIGRYDGPYMRRRCYCSKCGEHSGIGGIPKNQEKPYCPNCGAKMDGESDE